jgi:opacity protein-like surface antigen
MCKPCKYSLYLCTAQKTALPFMKKNILFSLMLISFFLISKAQKYPMEYGFQSGLNLNSMHGNTGLKQSASVLTGLSVGGHFKININRHFGLKAILAYDQYGWALRSLVFADNIGNAIGKSDVLIRLNYLNLPLLAEYSFGNKVKFNLDGGVFLGFLISNKIITKVTESLQPGQPAKTSSTSNNRKTTNFGLALGAGIQIPITNTIKLDFGVRDNLGLTNIDNSKIVNSSSIKTNAFSIFTAVTFGMK